MQAVRLDPQYAEAWHNLGLAYLMTGRTADAVEPCTMRSASIRRWTTPR